MNKPWIAALALVALALSFFTGCTRGTVKAATDSAPTIGVVPAQPQDLSRDVVLAAEFRPYQQVDLHAKVAGYVKTISVDVGDRVKKGQLLAVLEIPELQDEITESQAGVGRSDADLKRAQGELQRAQSAYTVGHLAYSRLAEVAKARPNLIAQQELDDAQAKERMADAQVSAAQAAVSAAQEQQASAKAALAKLQTMYSYARITAPFDGVITKRYADTGAMIQAGTSSQTQAMPVVQVSQNNLLRLDIPVPESVVAQVHLGEPVQVRVPSLGRTINGKVTRFADKVDMDTRTMLTEIDVPNPKLQLVPGMYAEATTVLEKRRGVLSVPVQAIDRHANGATVLVATPQGVLEQREVKLGLETPNAVEVTSGLKNGDLVVVSSRGLLRAGQRVNAKRVEVSSQAGES